MMGGTVEETRLIQIFLSPTATPGPNVYEVTSNSDGVLFCNCPGFKGRNTCKHTKFVQARIDSNGGHYPLEISKRATEEDAEKAKQSPKDFREFVIRFGKIEVF